MERLPIYGDGSNVRDWLYVTDHCRTIWQVLEAGRPGEVYGVGGASERTNLQVVTSLCELLDELLPDSPYRPHGRLRTFVADRPGHDARYAIDAHRLRSELGWEPREDFESGLRRTLVWYLEQSDLVRARHGRQLSRRASRVPPMNRKSIVLAGGAGTRLYPLTRTISK